MDEQKKEKPKPVPVRVVGTKGDSALVEWDLKRVYVPASSVKDGAVSPVTLKRAVPYGVPWDKLDEGLAKAFHDAGLWTQEDLTRNARLSFEIARGRGLSLGDLNRFAHKEG